MAISKYFFLLIFLNIFKCSDWKDESGIPAPILPQETQTGTNTFGCYVNGNLYVAQMGFAQSWDTTFYADYIPQTGCLEITTFRSGLSSDYINLKILHPKENVINTSFNVFVGINKQQYAALNWFTEYNDGITSYIDGNQNIGEVFITRLDTINKIVSGNFHCKLGRSENFNIVDINTYKLDSIANISQGRFDLIYMDNNY